MKFGIKGTQGEFQTSTLEPLEMEMQGPLRMTLLFFIRLFQSQDDKGFEVAFSKETPFLRYLPLNTSIQRRGALIVIFQLSRARRELFIESMERMPKPPRALGWQILAQDKKDRFFFFSWKKPYQKFFKPTLISEQKFVDKRKIDII